MEDTASLDAECVQAAEEAMHEAAKYETRCEALVALVEQARTMLQRAPSGGGGARAGGGGGGTWFQPPSPQESGSKSLRRCIREGGRWRWDRTWARRHAPASPRGRGTA